MQLRLRRKIENFIYKTEHEFQLVNFKRDKNVQR